MRPHADLAIEEDAGIVGIADETASSFTYSCKINGYEYTCEIDTAASDIFMPETTERTMGLDIEPRNETVTLGDGTSVQTVGVTVATVNVGEVRAE